MNFFNRTLLKVQVLALLVNLCMSLALNAEFHDMHADQDRLVKALPSGVLKPLPVHPIKISVRK